MLWSVRSQLRAATGTASTSPNGTSTGSQVPSSCAAQAVSAATSVIATVAPTSSASYRRLLSLVVTSDLLVQEARRPLPLLSSVASPRVLQQGWTARCRPPDSPTGYWYRRVGTAGHASPAELVPAG